MAELSHGDCPRFKARGVNGSSSHAVCDAVAMLNNLSIVIFTLSILPDKLQFVEFLEMPKSALVRTTEKRADALGIPIHHTIFNHPQPLFVTNG